MANLKAGTLIGGNLIWSAGNLPLRVSDSNIFINDTQIYTEKYKPTPSAIGAVNKAGDTMTGNLDITHGNDASIWINGGTNKDAQLYFTEDGKNHGAYIRYAGAESDNKTYFGTRQSGVEKHFMEVPRFGGVNFPITPTASSAPTASGHLTRKDYVDSQDEKRLPVAGGTMTGKLVLNYTSSVKVPVGSTSQRGSGVAGDFRFNSDEKGYEGFDGSEWQPIGSGRVAYTRFTANFTAVKGKGHLVDTTKAGIVATLPSGMNEADFVVIGDGAGNAAKNPFYIAGYNGDRIVVNADNCMLLFSWVSGKWVITNGIGETGALDTENYLKRAGDTMNGDLKFAPGKKIVMPTTDWSVGATIETLPAGDGYGSNLNISSGGNTVLGAGESATNLRNLTTGENLYLAADGIMYFHTNANTWADRTTVTLNTAADLSGIRNFKNSGWLETGGTIKTIVNGTYGFVAQRNDYQALVGCSATAGEYLFGGKANSASDYQYYIRLGNNKFQYTAGSNTYDIYHTGKKPTSVDIGAVAEESIGGLPDHVQAVVLLHPISGGQQDYKYFFGQVKSSRHNGNNPTYAFEVNTQKRYNSETSYQGTAISIGESSNNIYLASCMYNGVRYLALHWHASDAQINSTYVTGRWSNKPILVQYYNNNTSTVLNAEVKDSLTKLSEVHVPYTTLRKPTTTDIGAFPISGGTVTGATTFNGFVNIASGNLRIQGVNVFGAAADVVRVGDADITRPLNLNAKDGVVNVQKSGGTLYRVYHQGFKPSAADVGALSTSGGTFSGDLISSSRNGGNFGTYDSTKTDQVWSMGTSYRNSADGSNFGNLYGLAYKHTNNATGGYMAGGHQIVMCENGTPKSALGQHVWSSGRFISAGTGTTFESVGGNLRSNTVDVMSMDGKKYSFVTSPMDAHLCYNSYWDGSSWKKYDNSKTSGYVVVNSIGLRYMQSPAGNSNPNAVAHEIATYEKAVATFYSNWSNYSNGYDGLSITKNGAMVALAGLVKKHADGADNICTLPVGYRPAGRKIFLCGCNGGFIRIDVDTNGVVSRGSFGGGESASFASWTSLEAIRFSVL